MSDQGATGPPSSGDASQPQPQPQPTAPQGAQQRLGNPTRLIPRRTPAATTRTPDDIDPIAPEPAGGPDLALDDARPSYPSSPSRSFANGRIQVLGFGPGCIIFSLIASVVLTILLNIVF